MELMVTAKSLENYWFKRLMARLGNSSIEAQERHERDEKIFVDD